MRIYKEISLEDFEPWSGAIPAFVYLRDKGALPEIEAILEELQPEEGFSETDINNMFWFDEELLCSLAGLKENSCGDPVEVD